ncbi:MAG: S-methyl-5'-thioadenosine phosphorylase [Alphaproteobacteria bacterium]|nr:MAG: S-methyl-5'-thioadenosine phosphorylase [Alphaproteobacteria bacterium]
MKLGIIGGSGIATLAGIEDAQPLAITSPYGAPSAALLAGRIGGVEVVFLARHGQDHRIPPHRINYRANIDCLKRAGVTDILSLSACGSLREDLLPGTFVLVDQFIDRTRRQGSFFDEGIVAHVAFAEPTCSRLRADLRALLEEAAIPFAATGTYVAIEGPAFSTRAESRLYRAWGADVIGMTNLPEARLAREAEICYQTVAMVTDFDAFRDGEAAVDVAAVLEVLHENARKAGELVAAFARRVGRRSRPEPCPAGCDRALDLAIVTPRNAWDEAAVRRNEAILARLLSPSGTPRMPS